MIKTIDATLIDWPFYVRQSLNEDHVLYLTELYEQGINIPPIEVYKDNDRYIGIDGRHRHYAQINLLERQKIKVNIREKKELTEEIFDAFKSNLGGPLPPTKADIKHTIELLMSKTSREAIYRMFVPKYYDRATIKRYMDDIYSTQRHVKVANAKRAVLEGTASIPKAAEAYGIDEIDLRNALGGKKKGYKVNKAADAKNKLTNKFKSISMQFQGIIRGLIADYEEGNISMDDLFEVCDQIDKHGKAIRHNIANWKKRLEKLEDIKNTSGEV